MSEKITIRRFESQDLAAVQEMMCGGICEADCRCCACNGTGKTKADISPDFLLQHAQQSHFYVAESSGRIIGAAAIARWQSRNNESIIAFLYRHRDVPAEEIDPLLLTALEEDEFFLSADRVEISAAEEMAEFFETMGYSTLENVSRKGSYGFVAMEKLLIPDWEALALLRQKTAHELIRRLGILEAWEAIGAKVFLTGALPLGLLLDQQEIEFCITTDQLEIVQSLAVLSRFAADPALCQMEYRIVPSNLEEEAFYEFKLTVMYDQAEWVINMRQTLHDSALAARLASQQTYFREMLTPERISTILMLKFFTQNEPAIRFDEYCCAVMRDDVSSCEEFLYWRTQNPLARLIPWAP